jgi:hypothetical protein
MCMARRYSPATSCPSRPASTGSLPPFAMWPAFPTSDYYEGSATPYGHQQTTCLPAWSGRPGALPTFTSDRWAREASSYAPAASPRVRRSPSSWPPDRPVCTGVGVDRQPDGRALLTGPDPPGWSRHTSYGASRAGSSRTPSRLACRTRAVWRCRPVPSLSGLLPPSLAPPRKGCPQLQPGCCDSPAVESFHLHSVTWRLVEPRLRCRWMRNPRKSKPSSRWTILVLASDRRKPIAARTTATSSRRLAASARVPATMTTKSSAYRISR